MRADIHRLIHAVNADTIDRLLEQIKPDSMQLDKINKLRAKCNLEVIARVNSN